MYANTATTLTAAAATLAPPIRRSVPESAAAVVRVKSPSGTPRRWTPDTTPYMLEPMEMLESRHHSGVVFVGPARSGKTFCLIDCWLAHNATCSPSSAMVIQATQIAARDYERARWRNLKRLSPEFAAAMSPYGHDDNSHDKTLLTGDIIQLKWPSPNELQGKDIRRVALTDMDRMPLDIGGQGSPFELARVRTTTYLSLGMTLAESSPGHEQTDPTWHPVTAHDAPPAKGIFSLYRQGDRRRLYWPCPHCGEFFMSPSGIDGFQYEVQSDLFGAVMPETLGAVTIGCPHCGECVPEDSRPAMLPAARWVPDLCEIDRHGTIHGTPPRSDIASFWLHGVHAAFTTWRQLVYSYLQALATYQATQDEAALRTVTMQRFAAPYVSRSREQTRRPTELESRIEREWQRGTVSPAVRYLVACVDVQGAYFSVMIVGVGVDRERWVIDRFELRDSARPRDLAGNVTPCDPAAYTEDWDLLTERVVCASYPLLAHPGKRLAVRLTLIDSGGKGSRLDRDINATARAYEYYRRLRTQGLAHRVALTKGTSAAAHARGQTVLETYPDTSTRADRHSEAVGDVPLYLLHVNAIKDALDADLKRAIPGPGYIHFPAGLSGQLFDELTAEVRTESGWEIASNTAVRNEAWDQLAMEIGSTLLPQDAAGLVRAKEPRVRFATAAQKIDWRNPPAWAGPQPHNTEIDRRLSPSTAANPTPGAIAASFKIM